jgi:pimeloyl-ACP methyl ester carboxylesterase
MPPAIISSEPELSVQAMRGLAADAQALMAAHGVVSHQAIVIGLSVGSFPATYLANRIGARLCAVASADRADLMLWQSPAARIIKRRAIQKGHRLAHYSKAMLGCHPVQNLAGVRADSVFVVGRRDPFVPPRRSAGLLSAIEQRVRDARVVALDAGHFKTLMASARYQRLFFMENSVRRYWEVRLPKDFAGRRVARPQV